MDLSLSDVEILSLVDLLKTHTELFTQADKHSLIALINTLPDDKEAISNNIILWYEERPIIEEAMFEKLSSDEGFSGALGEQNTPLTPEEYKQTIKDAISL
ncbi:hypothetical protein [Gloeothece verrucosa]|uniref:Uncharacterized protein n=1 Tax=Gloeothece verrucosa (strain PCC 7822) TaxID=497965 RepID=E0UEE1_GLOV7|nr:hypothetical protein [Gloeothece verrucosa]ADN15387.1 conserved hypothetical protein [Gloeothece verrucosa PCC 7822]